ncbi:hypothetical protein PHYBOEH_006195 [Phytophthora boehmeriae]|uniref:Uncharacterized protein n=1 Tax=Phytophthora boehmeriae TaxID=109152 RepID=A0A8T1WM44_9STRA|nr:hypothetical protein PHYBOEH_006195 [Phytophthora boehmeriae]
MALLHAWLVVLSACVLTLEIQRRLLLARVLGALVMLLAWGILLPANLQLKAACCAVVYHGAAEGLRQWQRSFPCVFERRKDRKVVLWLLFWARIFIWGATLGGISMAATLASGEVTLKSPWKEAAALAVYYELVEVLVMLYFAHEELPYLWKKRVGHWLGALLVGFLESSGRLDALLKSPLLAGMSPLALVGVLLMAMWLSLEIPWDQIAQASSSNVEVGDDFKAANRRDRDSFDGNYHSTSDLFVDTGNSGENLYFQP